MRTSLRLVSVLGVVTLATAFACGGDVDGSNFGSAGAPVDGTGANDNTGTFGGEGSGDGGGAGGEGSADGGSGSCFAPVDMYIMFDSSGSMGQDCNIGDGTKSKWCRAINALSGYFNSAGAKDQAAALQFFPRQGHDKRSCGTGDGYQTAAFPQTDFQALPSKAFDAVLNAEKPGADNGTPTEAAIRGLTRFTDANRRQGRVTIGILVTDGKPNGCERDTGKLANLLKAHFDATKSRTYVIGMQGAEFENLEAMALGGQGPEHPDTVGALTNACGTKDKTCHHWNVGDGDPAAFTAALAAIQESADGCKPGGGTVNPPR